MPVVSAKTFLMQHNSPKTQQINLKQVISELKSKRSQSTERKQGIDLQNEVDKILLEAKRLTAPHSNTSQSKDLGPEEQSW